MTSQLKDVGLSNIMWLETLRQQVKRGDLFSVISEERKTYLKEEDQMIPEWFKNSYYQIRKMEKQKLKPNLKIPL